MAHRGNPHSLPAAGPVVGREAELAEIETFLTKTARPRPWSSPDRRGSARRRSGRRAWPRPAIGDHGVLVSRPLESDATVSLAGLSDLLEGVADEVADELPGPQEDALNAALLREGDLRAPLDPGALQRRCSRRPSRRGRRAPAARCNR